MRKFNYISFVLFLLFACSHVGAQIVIGDGVTISKGTTMHISNEDVIINTDEIKGKGYLVITHTNKQNIKVAKDVKTKVSLEIDAKSIDMSGESKTYFALQYLPPLTPEVILAKEKERIQEILPVKYINFEGKTFEIEDEEQNQKEPKFTLGLEDFSTVMVMVDVMQVKGTQFTDYILPIYSLSFNDERNSDYAELYEFECLTALLKPPIV